MKLYAIGVSSSKYHGAEPLTYYSEQALPIGCLVSVPLRNSQGLGVVLGPAKADSRFQPKAVVEAYPDVRLPSAQLELLAWLRAYYPAPLSSIVQLFLPPKVGEPAEEKPTQSAAASAKLPHLTDEQSSAIKALSQEGLATALLHGDTGTGKTRVYLELTGQTLKRGRSAIILVPEIGLVPQIEQIFAAAFPGRVRSFHSNMTPKQRRLTWRLIHDTAGPQVVIGPRSALFMPVRNLGLVVVDEAHDNGYKQDQLPYYDATRVAARLANLSRALCLYGTATPRVADYWHLEQHSTPVVRLSKPVHADIKPPIKTVIDASDRQHFSRSTLFSDTLLKAISDRLAQGQQALIFLNRRGTARFVSCSACGWHAACPNCDTPLTYHGDRHQLRCHTCGISRAVPTSCPDCQSTELRYQRRGTKALQTELEKLFPEARIARFDSDNFVDETLAKQYKKLADGQIDILVGTQVVAKGLDLPKLSLVAIPQADLSTYLPDFTADEQTFTVLRQVIGRVGRTSGQSQVILQTYHPNSPVIQSALDNNWSELYQQQLDHRQKYNFPPFVYLLQLTSIKASAASARSSAEKLKNELQKMYTGLDILGPAPRFNEKSAGKYHWQLVIKSKSRPQLLGIIAKLPAGWRYNIDPTNLL